MQFIRGIDYFCVEKHTLSEIYEQLFIDIQASWRMRKHWSLCKESEIVFSGCISYSLRCVST